MLDQACFRKRFQKLSFCRKRTHEKPHMDSRKEKKDQERICKYWKTGQYDSQAVQMKKI